MKWTTFFLIFLLFASAARAESPDPKVLSIDEAVEQGQKKNLVVLAQRYSLDIARADQLQASLRRNPYFSAQASLNPFGPAWYTDAGGGPRQIDLALVFPIDASGKRPARMDMARISAVIAEAMFADRLRQTARDVRLASIEFLQAEDFVRLHDEREATLRRMVATIQNRIGGSGLQPLLLSRARMAADSATQDARLQRQRLNEAERDLARLVGMEAGQTIRLSTHLRKFEFAEVATTEVLIREARENRPDLQAAKMTLQLVRSQQDLAHANVWDDLSFLIGLTYQGRVMATAPDPYLLAHDPFYAASDRGLKDARSFAFGFTVPIPYENRNQGEIRKAELLEEQLKVFVRDTEYGIDREILAARERLLLFQRQIRDYESGQLQRANQVREIQQRIFGTGGSNLLEYFDAEQAYHATLTGYYDAVAGYRKAQASLEAAKGATR